LEDRLFNEINADILAGIGNIHEWYAKKISGYKIGKENLCPLHGDKEPSLKIFENGGYRCKGCNRAGGGPVHFLAELSGRTHDFLSVQKEMYHKYVHREIPQVALDKLRKQLTDEIVERLSEERGYTREVLDHFGIGWTEEGGRLTIPVQNRAGWPISVIVYDVFGHRKEGVKFPKVRPLLADMPIGDLWPAHVLDQHLVAVLCEGYGDTICALSHGFPGVTAGGTHNRIKSRDLMYLKKKEIYIAFDGDDAGREGARARAEQILIANDKARLKVLSLPEGSDVTSFLVENGKEAFEQLIESTPWYEPMKPIHLSSNLLLEGQSEGEGKSVAVEIPFVPLRDVVSEDWFGKTIKTEATVIGKSSQTVTFPRRIRLKCSRPRKKCVDAGTCPMVRDFQHEYHIELDTGDPWLLKFAEASNSVVKKLTCELMGLSSYCPISVDILSTYVASKVLVTTPVKFNRSLRSESTHMNLFAYYFSPYVSMNSPYLFQGYIHRHPADSTTVGVFPKAEPVTMGLGAFEVTDRVVERLMPMLPPAGDLWDYLMDYYQHCAMSLSRIWERPITHMAADLVFFSPVSFYFSDKFVRKASLDALIIGDPRCGKNEIAEGFMRYYEHGELVCGENLTLVNLLGGIQLIANYNGPAWGRIPMRNRDTLIIDEASALPEDAIGHLSEVRHAGIASINKASTNVCTDALTGLLWLSNPRNKMLLSEQHNAIKAILELGGAPEDVARWDYAHTVAINEVKSDVINRRHPTCEHKFTKDQYHTLILWIKSRQPEQIVFTDEATDAILAGALDLGERYHPKGFLIQAENAREKIAKIAAAIAGKLWSTDETHEKLVIRDHHVTCAIRFLRTLYDSKTLGYISFTEEQRYFEHLNEDFLDELFLSVASERDIPVSEIVKGLQGYDHLSKEHFATMFGIDRFNASAFANGLSRARAIKFVYNHYVKTELFRDYLTKRDANGFKRMGPV